MPLFFGNVLNLFRTNIAWAKTKIPRRKRRPSEASPTESSPAVAVRYPIIAIPDAPAPPKKPPLGKLLAGGPPLKDPWGKWAEHASQVSRLADNDHLEGRSQGHRQNIGTNNDDELIEQAGNRVGRWW
ncbi:hypothetical protein RUND412_005511 [Rhizina undulata]